MKLWLRLSACISLLMATGCAIHKYRPAPISTVNSLALFEARSLADAGLKQFIETNTHQALESWPLRTWTLDQLTLAAYYYSPDLDLARANVANAEAGTVTAGARPNPTIGFGAGHETSPENPYLWNLDFTLPIETAGKRGYRVLEARQLTEASRLALAESAWQVRMKVRSALLEYLISQRQVGVLGAEEKARVQQVHLLQRRLEAGEIARPELNNAELDLTNLRLALRSAEGSIDTNRSVLAAAIGISVVALADHDFAWPKFETPSPVSVTDIQKQAALNRLDLRQALAEYQASEANLRLQIAKQYPDVQLGPHADHQEGYNNFSLGVSLELPILNQNQGPIAEAEARRKQTAAQFHTLQAGAIAEANGALASYKTALAQLAEADAGLKTVQQSLERQAARSVQRGEEDRTFLTAVQIQAAITARAHLDALHNTQLAFGALENAIQRPLTQQADAPNVSQQPARNEK
jgi:cobalt-zinc-cadmium efflux system outer membrane protein